MTDVLKLALERRKALQREVEKLDEFIRVAETLMSGNHAVEPVQPPRPATATAPRRTEAGDTVVRTALRRASDADRDDDAEPPRPSLIRRSAT